MKRLADIRALLPRWGRFSFVLCLLATLSLPVHSLQHMLDEGLNSPINCEICHHTQQLDGHGAVASAASPLPAVSFSCPEFLTSEAVTGSCCRLPPARAPPTAFLR